MRKKTSYIFVGLALFAILFASCSNKKQKNGRTDTFSSGVISFASDESFSPIVEEEVQLFEFTHKLATLRPVYTSESDAVNMLLKGKVFLAITARDYKENERQNLRDRRFNPRAIPFAYDGLALIVNVNNPDTCISVKNIADVVSLSMDMLGRELYEYNVNLPDVNIRPALMGLNMLSFSLNRILTFCT